VVGGPLLGGGLGPGPPEPPLNPALIGSARTAPGSSRFDTGL